MATAALVLAGGGLKCVSQVWWCEELLPALVRSRIDLKLIGGSSGGAINGAKLAEGDTDDELLQAAKELSAVWQAIDRRGSEVIFPVSRLAFVTHAFSAALLDGSTLFGLMDGSLFGQKPLDVEKIAACRRQLDVFVTNKLTRKKEVISNRDPAVQVDSGRILKAVVASASRHPLFPPVTIDGTPYGDGEDISLKRAFQADCDFIFILLPFKKGSVKTPGDDFFSRKFRMITEAFTDISSKSQEAEEREIAGALEKVRDLDTLEALRRAERSHFWTVSGKVAVDERFRAAPFSFQGKKKPRIITVYLEDHPRALKTYNCGRGDLLAIRGSCREQMRSILSAEGIA